MMPSVRISANREIMLIVMPTAYISATAASSAAGIPAATQIAVRAFRNRNSSPTTSANPSSALSSSSASRAEICSARARTSSAVTPCGRVGDSASTAACTSCCMPIASPEALRWTEIVTLTK